MSLYTDLSRAQTEEDVKDAYINALGLVNTTKGQVDIKADNVWFEAKFEATSPIEMFGQLLCYVHDAWEKGEALPSILCVIDREKAALMQTDNLLSLIKDKKFYWPNPPSSAGDYIENFKPHFRNRYVVYHIHALEKEFINAFKITVRDQKILRIYITPANLRQAFDKWMEMIGREIFSKKKLTLQESDFAILFFADIMHDGTQVAMSDLSARLLFDGDKPKYYLDDVLYELKSHNGYRRFWSIYFRPPDEIHRRYLLERRDSLLPIDERRFKGAFYTPLHIVDTAYDLLAENLGVTWQDEYIVWDMCCGVGNLEVKHSNLRNVFMSTLDQRDLDIMVSANICPAATKFQYDYLNDDVDLTCLSTEFNYALTNKMPPALRQAIADNKAGVKNAKKFLILMNPPYAEAANSMGNAGKTDVANTKIGSAMGGLGYAARELFIQFLHRISLEIPNATIATFSTLKYVNAPNFERFRHNWRAKYLDGFVVHSKAFDGLKGNFPIGFLIWDSSKKRVIRSISTKVIDKTGIEIDKKYFYAVPNKSMLTEWIARSKKNNIDAVPLINAITPASKTEGLRNTKWSDNAIGHFFCSANDFQHVAMNTAIFSSVNSIGHSGSYFIKATNLWQVAVVFAVRRLIKKTWLNDRDQFLRPTKSVSDDFKIDCLIWMLFNDSNLTAGADGLEWNGKTWSLVNHFIPYRESDVGARGRFESDFMVRYLADKTLTPEALLVLNEGKKIWQFYHAHEFDHKTRDLYKLNRPDVGWYQIRNAVLANSEYHLVDFTDFKAAYDGLSQKLRPLVYEYGFLLE
ncbi:MAG: hypothetical protein QM537_00040 [Candidatus Symbiobacter sp.]|nr:hypothetical protein [Candidatus Symbiobacter sp.]